MLKRHLQSFVVDGVDRVPLDAGLPLALACFVGEQVTFDVTENKQECVRRDGVGGVSLSFQPKRRENMSTAGFL